MTPVGQIPSALSNEIGVLDRAKQFAASSPRKGDGKGITLTPLQRNIHIGTRITVAFEQAAHPTRPARGHERARAKQVIFAPAGPHVTEIEQAGGTCEIK